MGSSSAAASTAHPAYCGGGEGRGDEGVIYMFPWVCWSMAPATAKQNMDLLQNRTG